MHHNRDHAPAKAVAHPMLNQMRSLSQNWFGRTILGVVLGFIIISFAVWGIGDRFTNFNANELAKVGSTHITVDQFRTAFQNQLQQAQQKQKRGITNEEARRSGMDRQVLSRLLTDTILDQQALRMGLAVGDDEIAQSIMRDSYFKGADGNFDQAQFDRVLRDNGYTETSYARLQRGVLLRQDVSNAVVGGLDVPPIVKDAIHRFQAEIRDLDFVVLPPSAAGAVPAPTEAEAKTYYDDHASSFIAPEYRKLIVLSVVPADLIKPDAVTDADVQKRYDEAKAERFTQPEKRTIEQIVFTDKTAASAAEQKLKNGESFAALATEQGKSTADISLGTVAKSEIADPAVAAAAFALPANGVSAPVAGQFGTVIVHNKAIVPGRQQTLQEVSASLKDEIAIVRARQLATQLRDKVEDQRAAGKTLTEAATSAGLKTRTIDAVDNQGRDKNRKPIDGLVGGPQLLKAAFATDVGADTEMIRTGNSGDVWFEVAGVDPSHKLPLADVKARVEADWRRDEVGRRLAAAGDKLVGALNAGKPITEVAANNGKLAVMEATNVGRGGGPQLPALVASSFFGVPNGKAGSVTYGAQGRIVFKIKAAKVPPIDPKDEEFNKLMAQVKPGFEDDVKAQYLARVQGELGVTINQQALQTALGESGS